MALDIRPRFVNEVRPLAEARTYPLSDITGERHEDLTEVSGDPFPHIVETLDDGAPFIVDKNGDRRCYYCLTKEAQSGQQPHYARCPFGRMLKAYEAEQERDVRAIGERVRVGKNGRKVYGAEQLAFSTQQRHEIERLIRELTYRAAEDTTAVLSMLYALEQADCYRMPWPKHEYDNALDARAKLDMINRMVSPSADIFARDQRDI